MVRSQDRDRQNDDDQPGGHLVGAYQPQLGNQPHSSRESPAYIGFPATSDIQAGLQYLSKKESAKELLSSVAPKRTRSHAWEMKHSDAELETEGAATTLGLMQVLKQSLYIADKKERTCEFKCQQSAWYVS